MHITALHDRHERACLFGRELLLPNRFLRIALFVDIDNRKTRIVHPSVLFTFERVFNVIGHSMKFLRAHYKIDMGQILEQIRAARLGHASEKPEHDMRPIFRHPAKHSHFAERLLIGHVAHAARIQEDNVRIPLRTRTLIAPLDQRMGDLLRVALVHLAAICLYEEFRHGRAEIIHKWPRSATSLMWQQGKCEAADLSPFQPVDLSD
jgi:hypothetical protein